MRFKVRKQDPPDENRWYWDIPTAERTAAPEGGAPDFKDILASSAKDEAEYNRENADYINFDPNKDSIAHKEQEEAELAKKDKDMEDGMLGS